MKDNIGNIIFDLINNKVNWTNIPDEEFQKFIDNSSKTPPEEGEVIKGRVVKICNDFIVVDIAYKGEGYIPIEQFPRNEKGELDIHEGDDVFVCVEALEDENGEVVLSKEKADVIRAWEQISRASEGNATIEGTIIGMVKGGMTVDIGVKAFLPNSQIDIRPIKDLHSYIGQRMKFKVLKYNKKRGNIVLSRRAILEEEKESQRLKLLEEIKIGKKMEGVIKNITEYGVFIDLGGVDGLLHITDISWGRVNHPGELFNIGDRIEVMILRFDEETKRVSLGLKQLRPDPWLSVPERYTPGSIVKGTIIALNEYGILIEIEEGVEGFIQKNDISWTRKIKHPSKFYKVGEEIEAVVLSIDNDNRRLALSLKHLEENPWEAIAKKYPVGTVLKGRIRNITDVGLFINVNEPIDGFIHVSDISYSHRTKNVLERFKKGDIVEAKVIQIEPEKERFALSIKAIKEDPWANITSKYYTSQIVRGQVVNIAEFGIFVEIEEGIEGLVHISELNIPKGKKPSEVYSLGQSMTVEIISIDPHEKRLALSEKSVIGKVEGEEIHHILKKQKIATAKLGDIMDEKLKEFGKKKVKSKKGRGRSKGKGGAEEKDEE